MAENVTRSTVLPEFVHMMSYASLFNAQTSTAPTLILSNDKAIRGLIDQLLSRAGLTQSEVARRLGLNRSTVQKYRDGKVKHPSLAWFIRLAEVCGAKIYIEFPAKPL